jgi:hypothetical protein
LSSGSRGLGGGGESRGIGVRYIRFISAPRRLQTLSKPGLRTSHLRAIPEKGGFRVTFHYSVFTWKIIFVVWPRSVLPRTRLYRFTNTGPSDLPILVRLIRAKRSTRKGGPEKETPVLFSHHRLGLRQWGSAANGAVMDTRAGWGCKGSVQSQTGNLSMSVTQGGGRKQDRAAAPDSPSGKNCKTIIRRK